MSTSRNHATLAMAMVVAVMATGAAAHVPLQPPGSISVQIELNLGGAMYSARGTGECNYSPEGSLYKMPGHVWSIRRKEAGHDLSFTLWRLASGGDMFTLSATTGAHNHRVNTLQVGPPADRRGSGTATFEPKGKGGQFTINAVDDTGSAITGTLWCSAFTSPGDNGD